MRSFFIFFLLSPAAVAQTGDWRDEVKAQVEKMCGAGEVGDLSINEDQAVVNDDGRKVPYTYKCKKDKTPRLGVYKIEESKKESLAQTSSRPAVRSGWALNFTFTNWKFFFDETNVFGNIFGDPEIDSKGRIESLGISANYIHMREANIGLDTEISVMRNTYRKVYEPTGYHLAPGTFVRGSLGFNYGITDKIYIAVGGSAMSKTEGGDPDHFGMGIYGAAGMIVFEHLHARFTWEANADLVSPIFGEDSYYRGYTLALGYFF